IDPFIRELPSSKLKVELYPGDAEKMPFDENSFDTVVSTFSFCSVSNPRLTLKEISRVLKPDGKLLFLEHGKAESRFVQQLQNIANPLYNVFAFGCNVNRDYRQIISDAGFIIESYRSYRAKIVPKLIVGYLHEGIAINEKLEDTVR
ncbi:MAG: methyltransferase domain-containing protein, partial [Oscillospiraceae bacterium]